MDTRNPAIGARARAEIFWGFYERNELKYIRRYLRRDLPVIELGASIGVTGAQVLRRIDSGGFVVSIEANAELLPTLRANLERHRRRQKLVVEHAAVDYDGSRSWTTLASGSEHVSSSLAVMPSVGSQRVPRATLAELLAKHDVDRYVLICDIEGAEVGLFAYEEAALARCDQLLIELHGSPRDNADEVRRLERRTGLRLIRRSRTVFLLDRV